MMQAQSLHHGCKHDEQSSKRNAGKNNNKDISRDMGSAAGAG